MVMIIGSAEPGQGEILRRRNKKRQETKKKKKVSGRERRERERRHRKLIKRQLAVVWAKDIMLLS